MQSVATSIWISDSSEPPPILLSRTEAELNGVGVELPGAPATTRP
jgi:hypothetical protein